MRAALFCFFHCRPQPPHNLFLLSVCVKRLTVNMNIGEARKPQINSVSVAAESQHKLDWTTHLVLTIVQKTDDLSAPWRWKRAENFLSHLNSPVILTSSPVNYVNAEEWEECKVFSFVQHPLSMHPFCILIKKYIIDKQQCSKICSMWIIRRVYCILFVITQLSPDKEGGYQKG